VIGDAFEGLIIHAPLFPNINDIAEALDSSCAMFARSPLSCSRRFLSVLARPSPNHVVIVSANAPFPTA
jgi:hypothetical protein